MHVRTSPCFPSFSVVGVVVHRRRRRRRRRRHRRHSLLPFGPGRDCFPRRRVVAPAVSPLPFVVGESVVCDSVPELRGLPAGQW